MRWLTQHDKEEHPWKSGVKIVKIRVLTYCFFKLIHLICIHIRFDNSPMVTSNLWYPVLQAALISRPIPPGSRSTEHPYRHQSTNCRIFVRHLRHVRDQEKATSVLRKHSNMLSSTVQPSPFFYLFFRWFNRSVCCISAAAFSTMGGECCRTD